LSNVYAIGNEVLNVRQFRFRKQKNKKYFKQANISVIFIQKCPLPVRFMYKQGTFANKLYF